MGNILKQKECSTISKLENKMIIDAQTTTILFCWRIDNVSIVYLI